MPELPQKIAFCAPGRESLTAIMLSWREVDYDEVRSTPVMEGRDDVILADMSQLDPGLSIVFPEPKHTPSRKGSVYGIGMLPPVGSSLRLISGI
jgi:hypothetical protein